MTTALIRLPPGTPFVLDGKCYYRECHYKRQRLIKAYAVENGILRFLEPSWFYEEQQVTPYAFRNVKPDYSNAES